MSKPTAAKEPPWQHLLDAKVVALKPKADKMERTGRRSKRRPILTKRRKQAPSNG